MSQSWEEFLEQTILDSVRNYPNEYCHPADVKGPRWVLLFDDKDQRTLTFDNEREAKLILGRYEQNGWNCHLFVSAKRND